jgi:phage gp16-like protein
MNALARPAQFDRSAQHRRAMLAKINIARHQLGMLEDDYRQLLFDTTGRISLRECDDRQLDRMVEAMKAKGFRPLPKKGGKPAAQHPMARKARALWISLHQLGVVHNPSEHALEAFAKRQLKCDSLVWARQSDAFRLIEALKDMGEKKGWRQRDPKTGKAYGPDKLKESLCEAILKRLQDHGAARMHWGLHDAAWKLAGIENAKERGWIASDYEELASALGAKLREAPGFRIKGDDA